METEAWVRLRTARAAREDIGTNHVRLDGLTRRHLRVGDDVVEVRNRSSVWARVVAARTHDDGLGLARLDPALLGEIEVEPGEWVFVRRSEPRPARHLTLRRLLEHEADAPGVESWSLLEGRILIIGDVVRVGASGDERTGEAHLSVVGLLLVTVDVRHGRLEPATVRVEDTDPEGPVRVNHRTTIDLLPPVGA